jgi:hypothetical protein
MTDKRSMTRPGISLREWAECFEYRGLAIMFDANPRRRSIESLGPLHDVFAAEPTLLTAVKWRVELPGHLATTLHSPSGEAHVTVTVAHVQATFGTHWPVPKWFDFWQLAGSIGKQVEAEKAKQQGEV